MNMVLQNRKSKLINETARLNPHSQGVSYLVLDQAGKLINQYTIKKGCLTIGRGDDNDIHLAGRKVSRVHARILTHSDCSLLEDLNSTNGTFVNAERISKHTLRDGDLITMAEYSLQYKINSEEIGRSNHEDTLSVELDELNFNKRGVSVDTDTLELDVSPDDDGSNTNIHQLDVQLSEKALYSSLKKPSSKQDLAQALKTLEELFD